MFTTFSSQIPQDSINSQLHLSATEKPYLEGCTAHAQLVRRYLPSHPCIASDKSFSLTLHWLQERSTSHSVLGDTSNLKQFWQQFCSKVKIWWNISPMKLLATPLHLFSWMLMYNFNGPKHHHQILHQKKTSYWAHSYLKQSNEL